jgi:hypothetical protein
MNAQNKCGVCQTPLDLNRREVKAIADAIKHLKKDRYFVPDEEVYAVVHKIHSQASQ